MKAEFDEIIAGLNAVPDRSKMKREYVKCESWPKVEPDDDGIRPAGRADECFYCHSRVGQPHREKCVSVEKKVRYDATFTLLKPCAGYPEGTKLLGTLDMYEPHSWDEGQMNFARNRGTWCATNAIDSIEWEHPDAKGIVAEYVGGFKDDNFDMPCLCNELEFELFDVMDDGPFVVRLKETVPA